jgi:hypothetical protein
MNFLNMSQCSRPNCDEIDMKGHKIVAQEKFQGTHSKESPRPSILLFLGPGVRYFGSTHIWGNVIYLVAIHWSIATNASSIYQQV